MRMNKIIKFIEFSWLIIASISFFEILNNWEINREKSYFFGIISIIAIFMFFLRKNQRKHNSQN